LHAEAAAYARSVGISLNGLLLVALRDYLDGRRATPSSGVPSVPIAPAVSVGETPSKPAIDSAAGAIKAPKNPRAPCPCGSRQQWRHCHGKGEKLAA
jgi:hypothetical protein